MQTQAVKAYKSAQVMTTDPYKLILMLYDACIKNLFHAREAAINNDKVKRGEALSKTIDILTELFSSVQGETEQAQFLRGLYSAMMVELPKVNLTNDIKTLDLAIKYVAQLRSIWKEQVMSHPNTTDMPNDISQKQQKTSVTNELKREAKDISKGDMGGRTVIQEACYKPFACKF